MLQAEQQSTTAMYLAPDQGRAFWDLDAAINAAGHAAIERIELPADAIKDFDGRVLLAEDSDGDSIVTPYTDDIADFGQDRYGVVIRVLALS